MESALRGNDFGAAGEPGDLEGELVGFGARVAEEDPRPNVGAQQAYQCLRQRDAGLGHVEVRRVAERVHLGGHGVDDGRVPVAEDVHRNAAE